MSIQTTKAILAVMMAFMDPTLKDIEAWSVLNEKY